MICLRTCFAWGLRLAGLGVLLAAGLRPVAATPSITATVYLPAAHFASPPALPADWLGQVNFYRTTANLPPVTENAAWSAGNVFHARYSVKTNTLQHDEDPANPWYTPEGQAAAQKSNLTASYAANAPDSWAIGAWMQAPFHALGILDPRLTQVGFGSYREADGGLQTSAGLDVIRGLNYALAAEYPVIWPAPGAVIPLSQHWGEYPDPLASCPGYAAPAGLPLLLQLGPGHLIPQVSASAITTSGAALEHCVFSESTYTHPEGAAQGLGRAILNSRDAVVLVPRAPLAPGVAYTVSLTANGQTHTWSFSVAANAESTAVSAATPLAFAGPGPVPGALSAPRP
ncbi:MAG: CAP domain-containing protein [Anaerolineales bacterium]|nr:CAP domain-containing protein [Anaerolineales bacterium]